MKTKEKNQLTRFQRRLKGLFLVLATIGLIISIFSLSENNVLTIISFSSFLLFGYLWGGFKYFLSLQKYRKTFIKFTIFLITLTVVSIFGYLQISPDKEEGIQAIYSLLYLIIIILLAAYFGGTLSNYIDKKEWEDKKSKRINEVTFLKCLLRAENYCLIFSQKDAKEVILNYSLKKGYAFIINLPGEKVFFGILKKGKERIIENLGKKSLNEFLNSNSLNNEEMDFYSKLLFK